MQEMFKTPQRRDYRKINLCNKRKCYDVFVSKDGGHFIVDGFSSYVFFVNGLCKNWKTDKFISSDGMEGKFILISDKGLRTTLRINGLINQILGG